jgi:ligand-binding sensor domain-containing protein/two-component sensor histidine kinase
MGSLASSQILDLEYYSIREGLPSHGVGEIYQDPFGRLWLGTSEGLSIYDGIEFRNYGSDDGLPRDFITSIARCSESPEAAWIGTLGGVCKLSGDRFSIIDLPAGANEVTDVFEDHRGVLWIGTNAGLYRWENGNAVYEPLQGDDHGVTGIAEAGDGTLWVALARSVVLLKPRTPAVYLDPGLNPPHELSAIHMGDRNEVWLGTTGGLLLRCDGRGVIGKTQISSGSIVDIAAESGGLLWICTEVGLFALEQQQFGIEPPARYGKVNGFSGDRFNCAFPDREGNLWVGEGQVLQKLRDRGLSKIPMPTDPVGKNPVVTDARGNLWVISGDRLLELSPRSNIRFGTHEHVPGGGPINSLYYGRDNILWVGFKSGEIRRYFIHRSQSNSSTRLEIMGRIRPGIELPVRPWVFFFPDSRGSLWLHTYPGITILEGEDFSRRTILGTANGLPNEDIRAIHEGPNGDIWVGGLVGGIVVYRRTEDSLEIVRRLFSGSGLDNDHVRAIDVDSLGRCWTGTRFGGLTITDDSTWQTLAIGDGLMSKAVLSIANDDRGTIWIGTHLGLQGIDARTARLTRTIAGLAGLNIHSCGVAGDFLWAYTRGFLAIYDLRERRKDPVYPLIAIRELRVNGSYREPAGSLKLSADENNVTIGFTGISLRDEKGVRYRYRLLGAAEDWSQPGASHAITYAALRPGSYTFEVLAINSDGVSSEHAASLPFTILPPFWQIWWFQLGVFIIVGILLWGAHKYRIGRVLEMERTRLRIAQDLHDEIGSTLSSISYFAQAVRTSNQAEERTDRLLSLIAESSSKARGAISDIIWSIDPSNDSWEDLLARMRRHASDILESKGIRYHINLPENLVVRPPGMQQRRHLWLLFKEMVANVSQHSGASSVEIEMRGSGAFIDLVVMDNGRGFDQGRPSGGNGLRSIRDRAKALGATLQLETGPGRGTSWSVRWKG